jgi:hypothetical protein
MRLILLTTGTILSLATIGGAFAASHDQPSQMSALAQDRVACEGRSGLSNERASAESVQFLACMESHGWDYFASAP